MGPLPGARARELQGFRMPPAAAAGTSSQGGAKPQKSHCYPAVRHGQPSRRAAPAPPHEHPGHRTTRLVPSRVQHPRRAASAWAGTAELACIGLSSTRERAGAGGLGLRFVLSGEVLSKRERGTRLMESPEPMAGATSMSCSLPACLLQSRWQQQQPRSTQRASDSTSGSRSWLAWALQHTDSSHR